MRRFLQSRALKAFVCVIIAIILGAVIAALSHSNNTPLSSATSTALYPLQRVSAYLSYKLSNFNDNFQSAATLEKENKELKSQIEQYQKEIIGYNEAKKKLETYEDFLGVKEENPDFIFESATIISRDSTDPYESFTLSKGSLDDIQVNDPVIYGTNLVGVVTSVSPASCTVSTIANPNVNVSVYETYTGEVGYTTGTGNAEDRVYCKLPGLTAETAISPNGILATSGSGGIYPKDLIVGTVVEVDDAKDGISSFATIRSAVNFAELSEVFIIKSFDGQGVVTVNTD
ncbi:MAG: rod shape-determining protein MreC [Clostridia bacterium]|nr:rod shape-determining protein MreC [Clostridia bacterium]MBQ3128342.1 rod shape-determining protein MreC [Clostridia bacterium]MBQ7044204.1 rod shape-determining protein MreC [Clostridia bacterium]